MEHYGIKGESQWSNTMKVYEAIEKIMLHNHTCNTQMFERKCSHATVQPIGLIQHPTCRVRTLTIIGLTSRSVHT